MSIYTRTGDTGTTSLFGGKRVLKCEELVDAYGSIDELNSWVGLVSIGVTDKSLQTFLATVQSDLFTIGSTLSGWSGDLKDLETRVVDMEKRIDEMEKELPELRNFILPGGSTNGARMHLARSICRRVERQVVALSQKQKVDARIIQYLNRLSDLFFMMARFINKKANVTEVVWKGIERNK